MSPTTEETKAAEARAAEEKMSVQQKAEARQKFEARQAGAVEAGQAVSDAVQQVARAAVAAIQKTSAGPSYDFAFNGVAGGKFEITGTGLGSSGTVRVSGQDMKTTEWGTMRIVGQIPAGTPSGEVVVLLDEQTTRRGYFKA